MWWNVVILPKMFSLSATAVWCNQGRNNCRQYEDIRWLMQNVNKNLYSQKTQHISPLRASFGMSIVRIFSEKWPRYNGTALYVALGCCFLIWLLKARHPPKRLIDEAPSQRWRSSGVHSQTSTLHHGCEWHLRYCQRQESRVSFHWIGCTIPMWPWPLFFITRVNFLKRLMSYVLFKDTPLTRLHIMAGSLQPAPYRKGTFPF